MTKDLSNLIREVQGISTLLVKTPFNKHSQWYEERCEKLQSGKLNQVEVDKIILEIKKSLVGMGSFDDLPLTPREGEPLTAADLRKQQWEIVERIGRAIEELKT